MKKRKSGLAVSILLCLFLLLSACAMDRTPESAETQEVQTEETEEALIPLYCQEDGTVVYGPSFSSYRLNPYDRESFIQGDLYKQYDDGTIHSLAGVDISEMNGEISFSEVAESGISFAMIRAGYRGYTEGGIYQDECFEQNIRGALDAGLQTGVYFYSQAISEEEAVEEAEAVLSWIKDYEITMPVAFDWEVIHDSEARTGIVSGEMLNKIILAFCDTIREAGYEPIVYGGSQLIFRGMDLDLLKDEKLWLVEFHETPSFYYDFAMWQYTGIGQIPGIQGNVDLNIYFQR